MDKKHILIVENNEQIRNLCVRFLSKEFEVAISENIEEALKMYKKHTCDLLLLDTDLSDIKGLEILRQIREEQPQCAVVLMLDYAAIEKIMSAVREGVDGFLVKPFDLMALDTAVKNGLQNIASKEEKEVLTGKKILIVDDDNEVLALFSTVFMYEKANVATASDGISAYQIIEQNLSDLVLTDVMMPKMDGFTLCQKIKSNEKLCKIPVIILTVRDTENDRLKAREAGADAYLVKLTDPYLIVEEVKKLIRM